MEDVKHERRYLYNEQKQSLFFMPLDWHSCTRDAHWLICSSFFTTTVFMMILLQKFVYNCFARFVQLICGLSLHMFFKICRYMLWSIYSVPVGLVL